MTMMTLFSLLDLVFCKQKTASEMRISDWSSDVCSSDLAGIAGVDPQRRCADQIVAVGIGKHRAHPLQIGGARADRPGRDQVVGIQAPTARPRLAHILGGHAHRLHADQILGPDRLARRDRSEEHTSELQSLMRISYAVLCLK